MANERVHEAPADVPALQPQAAGACWACLFACGSRCETGYAVVAQMPARQLKTGKDAGRDRGGGLGVGGGEERSRSEGKGWIRG